MLYKFKKLGPFSCFGVWVSVIFVVLGCATNRYNKPNNDSETRATESANFERIGDSYFKQNIYQKAFVNYDRAAQINPNNTHAQYKKGLTRLSAGQYQKALGEFKSVLEHDPNYAQGYEGQGRAYFLLNDQKRAIDSFQKAISIDARLWRSFAFLGILYDKKYQHEAAKTAHRQAIQLRPDKGALYNNLGISYLMVADYDAAIRSFKTALRKSYQNPTVYNNLGYALSKKTQYEEAYHAYLNAGGPSAAYNNLGCGFLANDDPENAMVYFRKAIETKPEFYKKAADNLRKAESANLK